MQIITLTVIWDQSSSVITFTTQLLAKQTNNQVRDRVTVTASAPSLGPDDPIWVRWPHASLGYLANVMTQEIYCAHKNGEIGSGGWLEWRQGGGPSQTWPQQRVLCQEFRKLSQTSLEIIHTISMSIDIDKKYKIDCIRLSYLFF